MFFPWCGHFSCSVGPPLSSVLPLLFLSLGTKYGSCPPVPPLNLPVNHHHYFDILILAQLNKDIRFTLCFSLWRLTSSVVLYVNSTDGKVHAATSANISFTTAPLGKSFNTEVLQDIFVLSLTLNNTHTHIHRNRLQTVQTRMQTRNCLLIPATQG